MSVVVHLGACSRWRWMAYLWTMCSETVCLNRTKETWSWEPFAWCYPNTNPIYPKSSRCVPYRWWNSSMLRYICFALLCVVYLVLSIIFIYAYLCPKLCHCIFYHLVLHLLFFWDYKYCRAQIPASSSFHYCNYFFSEAVVKYVNWTAKMLERRVAL